jgi:serine/threonine-protein kinase RsbW
MSTLPTELTLECPMRNGALPALLDRQEALLEGAGVDEPARHLARLVTEEILSNTLRHAAASRLTLGMALGDDGLWLRFADDAAPFDAAAAATLDPTTPLDGRQPGGLGLLLVQRAAKHLRYHREGSRNVLEVLLGAGPPCAPL